MTINQYADVYEKAGWQHLHTAPLNGELVRLMCGGCGEFQGVGSFSEHSDGDPPFWKMRSKDIGWSRDNPPTHWRPI
jgi:hypothetical protein